MTEKFKIKNLEETKAQFIKFFITGLINTFIDFSILNSLIIVFGLGETLLNYFVFKAISVFAAVTNSFFWNKKWVFKKESSGKELKKEMSMFYLIAFVGVGLNVAIATGTFSVLRNLFPEVGELILANLGALIALVAVMLWNFLGYKYIVFKR